VRLLVTGSAGQLGRALARLAPPAGHDLVGVDLPEFDVTDRDAVLRLVTKVRPEAIVNCAAFTAVDAAEEREAEAVAVNGTAVATLSRAADETNATLIQVSTDYVFDGRKTSPYRESDPPAPLSAYGRSKLAGEHAAALARRYLIVRTAWLYGTGHNFVAAIRRQLAAGASNLRVVDDQEGSPTFSEDLAAGILDLAVLGAQGVIHAVNQGSATWFTFAREIVRLSGATATVQPITTADMPRPAPRPRYSVLDTSRLRSLLGRTLPSWQDALARYLASPP
jgi:dTDP-4-dehydrorhamnose reductase